MSTYDEWLKRANTPLFSESEQPASLPKAEGKKTAGAQAVKEAGEFLEGLAGMKDSAQWSMGAGLLGIRPPEHLQEWQAKNPGKTLAAELGGTLVPYAGWAKVSSKIPKFDAWVNTSIGSGKLAKSPFIAGAAREVKRFAPFEAMRIAGNYSFGDSIAEATGGFNIGTMNTAKEAGRDLALGGVLGGGINKLASAYTKRIQTRGITPGADTSSPLQQQMREVLRTLAEGSVSEEAIPMAYAGVNRLRNAILKEQPSRQNSFSMKADGSPTDFNPLFVHTSNKTSSRLDSLGSGEHADSIRKFIEQHMPENWEAYAQYPRVLSKRGVKDFNPSSFLKQGDENLRWDFDTAEKKFIFAKKMDDFTTLVFKTDTPEVFMPHTADFVDAMRRFEATAFGSPHRYKGDGNSGSTVLDYGLETEQLSPVIDTRGLGKAQSKYSVAAMAKKATDIMENKSFGLGSTRYEIGAAVKGAGVLKKQVGSFIKDYLAPSNFQFADNPLALRIHRTTQKMLDKADELAQKAIIGNPLRAESSAARYKDAVMGMRYQGNNSIADRIKKLAEADEAGYRALVRTIQSEGGLEWGIRNGLTRDGAKILEMLQKADSDLSQSVIAAQRAAGLDESKIFQPKENHFMLSRSWQGDYRTPVYNENGSLVFVAGGHNGAESSKLAAEMVNKNPGWKQRDTVLSNTQNDIELLKQMIEQDYSQIRAFQTLRDELSTHGRKPGTMQQREGVGGYQVDYSPDELIAALVKHTSRYRRYEAEMAHKALFEADVKAMANSPFSEDLVMAARLSKRLDKMFGVRGEWDASLNKAVDKILGGVLGQDSASHIAQALNKFTYLKHLGFANMGYVAANIGTFMQTAFSQMSYINTLAMQAPERLGRYVSYQPIMSADGQHATVMGVLDPLKIAARSFRELGNPDETLWNNLYRAAAEGKVDPRFLNEYVGQSSAGFKRWKDIWNGKHPISDTLTEVGSFLPSKSEMFSRNQSFVMGHIFYRDVMNVKDPGHLYRLASEFTDVTQAVYGRSHKPIMFDGAAGQSMGLFKTWIANYTHWMAEYAGEGIKHNNWKPFLWQQTGTAALGGLGALPLFGVANALHKSLSEDGSGIAETLRSHMGGEGDAVGNTISNAVFFGIPAFFGSSVQGTVQSPFANPLEDTLRFFEASNYGSAIQLGKSAGLTAQTLLSPTVALDPATSRYIANAVSPKTAVRFGQALLSDDLRSMNTGGVLKKNLSMDERILWALSLNPADVSMSFQVFRDMKASEEAKQAEHTRLSRLLHEAIQEKNTRAISFYVKEAAYKNINLNSLMRSARTRYRQDYGDMFDQHFDKLAKHRMRQLGLSH